MKTKDLAATIDKVKPAIADGKLIQYAGQLIFDGEKLIAYGDEITISVPLKTDFEARVRFEEFSELIKKIKTEEVKAKIDSGKLLITAGKLKAAFNLIEFDKEALPNFELDKIEEWIEVPDDFASALGFCIFTAAEQAANAALTCLNVEGGRILSADNFRVTEKILSVPLKLAEPLLIPRKIASYLSKFSLKELASTDSCAHYSDGTGAIFTHRLISDGYPTEEVDKAMDIEGLELIMPEGLSNALETVGIAAVKDVDGVREAHIVIDKNKFKVTGVGPYVNIEDVVKGEYKGEALNLTVSPDHMKQILSYSNKAIIGDKVILFPGEGFRSIVCLLGDDEE